MVTGPAQVYSITRVQPWAHAQIKLGRIQTSHPRAIADTQMDSWRKIWEGERRDDADHPRQLADHEDEELLAAIRHLPTAALP
eukprot:790058-Pyramimonas_sp.AAC.1